MAHVKKGHLTASPEWWKHLRWMKRSFWKRERRAGRYLVRTAGDELAEKRAGEKRSSRAGEP